MPGLTSYRMSRAVTASGEWVRATKDALQISRDLSRPGSHVIEAAMDEGRTLHALKFDAVPPLINQSSLA